MSACGLDRHAAGAECPAVTVPFGRYRIGTAAIALVDLWNRFRGGWEVRVIEVQKY